MKYAEMQELMKSVYTIVKEKSQNGEFVNIDTIDDMLPEIKDKEKACRRYVRILKICEFLKELYIFEQTEEEYFSDGLYFKKDEYKIHER
jgi:hypothetical protein